MTKIAPVSCGIDCSHGLSRHGCRSAISRPDWLRLQRSIKSRCKANSNGHGSPIRKRLGYAAATATQTRHQRQDQKCEDGQRNQT
ncbi:hypothetical protein D3C86_2017720 [compost metagenome]